MVSVQTLTFIFSSLAAYQGKKRGWTPTSNYEAHTFTPESKFSVCINLQWNLCLFDFLRPSVLVSEEEATMRSHVNFCWCWKNLKSLHFWEWRTRWVSAHVGRTDSQLSFSHPNPTWTFKKSTLGLEIKVTWSGTMRVTNPNEGGWSRVGYPKFLPLIQDPSRTKSPSERSPFREQWRSGRGVPATTIVRLS